MLTILLDAKFDNLTPVTRVNTIENLAGFLGLHVVRGITLHELLDENHSGILLFSIFLNL